MARSKLQEILAFVLALCQQRGLRFRVRRISKNEAATAHDLSFSVSADGTVHVDEPALQALVPFYQKNPALVKGALELSIEHEAAHVRPPSAWTVRETRLRNPISPAEERFAEHRVFRFLLETHGVGSATELQRNAAARNAVLTRLADRHLLARMRGLVPQIRPPLPPQLLPHYDAVVERRRAELWPLFEIAPAWKKYAGAGQRAPAPARGKNR